MGRMSLFRDDGIVLRTQKLGEADRIITLLTRSSGRVRAVAKGVRRTSSRFGSRLEPFTHVDLQLAEGRSLDIVTQAETLDPFGPALRAMCDTGRPPHQVLDSFLLRSLAVAGYAPTFEACARCGLMGPHRSFSPAAGGMLCSTCRVPGAMNPSPEAVVLLGALLAGEWPVIEASEARHRREATGMVAAYLQWHLERGLKSLAHVDR